MSAPTRAESTSDNDNPEDIAKEDGENEVQENDAEDFQHQGREQDAHESMQEPGTHDDTETSSFKHNRSGPATPLVGTPGPPTPADHHHPVPIQPYAYPPPPYPYYPPMPGYAPPPQPMPPYQSSSTDAYLTGPRDPYQYTDVATVADPAPDTRRNRGGVTEPFPEKLHRMLEFAEREGLADVVSFFSHGRAFAIHKPRRFVQEIMPRYFRQTRLTSFQRQLNLYGTFRIHGRHVRFGRNLNSYLRVFES